MKRKGGARRRTRTLLTKGIRRKGKMNIKGYFQQFKEGDRVQLVADSTVQKGMFPLRFYGKVGTIISKQGAAYRVSIYDHTKEKSFVVHPIHLKRL